MKRVFSPSSSYQSFFFKSSWQVVGRSSIATTSRPPSRRGFRSSASVRAVRPYLLADIGEGVNTSVKDT